MTPTASPIQAALAALVQITLRDIQQPAFVQQDTPDVAAQIVWANPALAALTGYTLDNLLGASSLQFAAKEMLPDLQAYVRMRRQNQYAPTQYRATILHKMGERIEVSVIVCALPVADGHPLMVLVALNPHALTPLAQFAERFAGLTAAWAGEIVAQVAGQTCEENMAHVQRLLTEVQAWQHRVQRGGLKIIGVVGSGIIGAVTAKVVGWW